MDSLPIFGMQDVQRSEGIDFNPLKKERKCLIQGGVTRLRYRNGSGHFCPKVQETELTLTPFKCHTVQIRGIMIKKFFSRIA